MHKPLLALLALLSTTAYADTLVSNVNGIQVGADGQLQHFTGLLIADDGKVKTVLTGPPPPIALTHTVDGSGRTMLPGLIDGHGHVMDLGFAALRIDVTGTRSIAELQQRLRDYAATHPNDRGSSASAGTRRCGPRSAFRPRPTSMPSSATGPSYWNVSTAMRWSPTAPR